MGGAGSSAARCSTARSRCSPPTTRTRRTSPRRRPGVIDSQNLRCWWAAPTPAPTSPRPAWPREEASPSSHRAGSARLTNGGLLALHHPPTPTTNRGARPQGGRQCADQGRRQEVCTSSPPTTLRPLAGSGRDQGREGERRHTVVGSVKHPLNASDFRLPAAGAGLQGRHPGAGQRGRRLRQRHEAANEFGITKSMKVAGLLVFINDVACRGPSRTR